MKIRLAGGVVTSGLCAWFPRPSGPVRFADGSDAPPGAAVALGPAGATDDQVRDATAELAHLVRAGGVVAAGAGVDLGSGFRSARLAGAHGDQRDAVVAALRVLGVAGAHRLGERAGFMVALFGPEVTRRVGAAAARAIGEGRWGALHLASAASDLLGPEQLERILALRAPAGADIIPDGPPSALARHLRQVLEPVARPRRAELILDLWTRVLEHRAESARRQRRRATQSRRSRLADLRARRRHDDDERTLWCLRRHTGVVEPSLSEAARWTPPDHYWHDLFRRLVQDALAATALLRAAAAVADHGLDEGLAHAEPVIRAAAAQLPDEEAARSARRVPGLTGLPARPGAYVRDIHRRLTGGRPRDARFAGYVRPRLACARDYALAIIETAEELFERSPGVRDGVLRSWAVSGLSSWREGAGYSAVRPPAEWDGIPPWSTPLLGEAEPLARRLAAAPGSPAEDVEVVGDLLWYVELIDALAQVNGHDAAPPTRGTGAPWFDADPPPPETEPLTPRLDSLTLAVSGAAQLVALGGVPPRSARTWPELTAGLLAHAAIAEALTGEFAVPEPIAALDGTVVPGTGARVHVARSARTLAEWSDHMGNCIASPGYRDAARAGHCGLIGLYDKNGVLIVNAELRPCRPAARGWQITEIAARFNEQPEEELARRLSDRVARIPAATPDEADLTPPEESDLLPPAEPPGRAARRRSGTRLAEDAGPALDALARRAWADEVGEDVLATFAALAGGSPDTALTTLRRLGSVHLAAACRRALDAGAVDLDQLWAASGARPLESAVAALDPALRGRFDRLPLLFGEPPLPRSLRRLVKRPAIADVYALDLVARRTRRAIGRLAGDDDPAIARAIAHRATGPLLCALTVLIT